MRGVGLGRHVIAELLDCEKSALDDVELVERALLEAAKATKSTIISHYVYRFKPHGISGYVLVAESHLSIHTWPEYGYAAVDVFTCGKYTDPWAGLEVLKNYLKARHLSVISVERGINAVEAKTPIRTVRQE